jgi:hypothetical protein
VVTRAVQWLAIALLAGTAGCADVWGLQDLTAGDGGRSGSSGGDDQGGGADAQVDDDARVRPSAEGGVVATEAGSCTSDISVICGNTSQSGFSCTGSAAPPQSFTGLTCAAGQAGSGGATTYCCSGNWCGEVGDPQDDGAACSSCYMMNCTAPMCACDTDPSLDNQGYSLCSDYESCLANCQAPSGQECENQCAGSYSSTELAEGDAEANCIANYCAQECGIEQ